LILGALPGLAYDFRPGERLRLANAIPGCLDRGLNGIEVCVSPRVRKGFRVLVEDRRQPGKRIVWAATERFHGGLQSFEHFLGGGT
jgi:hypothetical protein